MPNLTQSTFYKCTIHFPDYSVYPYTKRDLSNIISIKKAVKLLTYEFNICSGTCKYKDINFTFIFNGKELQLVPPSDKRETILTEWLLTAIAPGAYTVRTSLTMDEPYLIGTCNETNSTFIFIARQGGHIGSQNFVLLVPIIAYIECRYNSVSIARMSFTSPVINCIHPVTKGFGCTLDRKDFTERGIFTVTTQSFNETTTVPQSFMVDDRPVSVNFSISSRLNIKLDEPPLILESAMNFEFDPTNDYYFIFRLWSVAKQFLQYLCYRKNIYLPEVALYTSTDKGGYEKFATMYVLNEDGDDEPSTLKSGRYIKQKFIDYDGDVAVNYSLKKDIVYGTTIQVNEAFPDTYRLVCSSENSIDFTLISHYDRNGWNGQNDSIDVYTIEYPIRMIKLSDGWRIDEFHTTMFG